MKKTYTGYAIENALAGSFRIMDPRVAKNYEQSKQKNQEKEK